MKLRNSKPVNLIRGSPLDTLIGSFRKQRNHFFDEKFDSCRFSILSNQFDFLVFRFGKYDQVKYFKGAEVMREGWGNEGDRPINRQIERQIDIETQTDRQTDK